MPGFAHAEAERNDRGQAEGADGEQETLSEGHGLGGSVNAAGSGEGASQLDFESISAVAADSAAAQRAQMQARFLASVGMRSRDASEICALKHQHSVLPWLRPQRFGALQLGHRLGSTTFSISRAHAS